MYVQDITASSFAGSKKFLIDTAKSGKYKYTTGEYRYSPCIYTHLMKYTNDYKADK